MNSVCNGKITEKTPFKNVYISYAPADVGNSIGAALYVAHCIHREKRDYSFKSSNIGPIFNDEEIEKAIDNRLTIIGRTEGDIIINDPLISRKDGQKIDYELFALEDSTDKTEEKDYFRPRKAVCGKLYRSLP